MTRAGALDRMDVLLSTITDPPFTAVSTYSGRLLNKQAAFGIAGKHASAAGLLRERREIGARIESKDR